MAQVSQNTLPPTPPPPVYSPPLHRSTSREVSPENFRSPHQRSNHNHNHVHSSSRPQISTIPPELAQNMGTVAEVHVHPPESAFLEQREPRSPVPMVNTEQYFNNLDRLSPVPQTLVSRKPLKERNQNMGDSTHRRVTSENPQMSFPDAEENAQNRSIRHLSASYADSEQPVENFEPLRYFHQGPQDQDMQALDKRASKMTINTFHSDGSGSSDPNRTHAQQPVLRNSYLGRDLPRPDSIASTGSDPRGRGSTPHLSPHRPASRNSRSPDTRPLSYVDLLNVPYPQNAPSGAENLVNAGLRNVVGNNASLLSTRKTLDMYRANVTKTNDPAIQYEFAVFMVGAAQEEGLESDLVSDTSSKSKSSPRDDLLKEAKTILQKLSDRSYPFAQYYLADGYASGLFNKGREDWERAFPLFLAASKHGHAEAGYRTALCYEFGWGCRVDPLKAVQFYQHAASKNHPGAMLRLGRACLTGEMGLTKRYREGIRWLKRGAESADHQYNQAPFDLGQLHETGFGPDVFKDEAYAAQLYTKAADLGHIEANFRLGEAYEFGQLSCPKDPALSIHFYTGAAEQNHAPSQMALCAWYMVGVDNVLDKDESEAYEWAKRAAENGLAKAQYTLGYFTEMGIGCRRDPLEANVWYVRAADQGEDRARHRIAAIHAASTGADPVTAAAGQRVNGQASDKKKKFGIF